MMSTETHLWLKWPGCDKDQKIILDNKLAELQNRGICPPRFITGSICETLRIKDRLKTMLKTKNAQSHEGLDIPVWERALNIKEQVFREWCLEFYSSLEVEKRDFTPMNFSTKKLIRFRLGGKEHKVSVPEFARLTGLFKQDEAVHQHIARYLLKGEQNSREFDAHSAWESLTGLPRHTGTSKASSIRSPLLRLVHRLLTHSFIHRSTQHDKVYLDDLWLLHKFAQGNPEVYVCVPWVLVCFMEARGAGRQKDSQMCCGHFITRIMKNLTFHTVASVRACSAPVDYKQITLQELETSKIVNETRNGLVDEIVPEADTSSDEEAGVGLDEPETPGKMKRGTQKQLLNEMKQVRKMMIEVGCGVRRIEQKVDCAVADYQYHTARYQPFWESQASAQAQASGTAWPEYAPPPPYAPEQEEEEEVEVEEGAGGGNDEED